MKTKQLPQGKRWKMESARQRGSDAAAFFMARVQARYNELLSQACHFENKALRRHYEGNILPAVAAYSVLLMDGMDKDAAGQALDSLMEAGIEPEKRMYRFWGRFSFFFDMIRLMLKPMIKMQFPEGWDVEWIEADRNLVGLNCRSCFYLDRLKEHGFPELTPHFCRLDDVLTAEAAEFVRFERTQTIGRGGRMCDFRYRRVRLGD